MHPHVVYTQFCTLGIVMDVDSVCYENTPSLTCSYPNIMDMGNGR